MRKLPIIIFFLNSLIVNGQNIDSTYNEVNSQPDNSEIFAIKSRIYLYNQLLNNNRQKVINLQKYYTLKHNDTIYYLTQKEKILINFWVGNYDFLLSQYNKQDFQYLDYPLSNDLYNIGGIMSYLISHKELLNKQIDTCSRSEIDKDFLKLYLSSCLIDYNDYSKYRDKINDKANEFIVKYPTTSYTDFVRKNIRYQWTKSNFEIDINLIGGYSLFIGDLKDNFKNGFTFGAGLGLNYWRFNTFFRFHGGNGKTKTTFDYKGLNWSDNQKIFKGFPEISVGFAVLDKKIKLTPYYGLCWPSIEKVNGDSINQPTIKFNVNQIYGLDFKWSFHLNKQNINSIYYHKSFNIMYLFLRVGYMSPFANKPSNEQFKRSDTWLFNFGFGFIMQTRKHVK